MTEYPLEIAESINTESHREPDDLLITSASWEERCLGLARRLGDYKCRGAIMSVYDNPSEQREKHIPELTERLLHSSDGNLFRVSANHKKPLPNVRQIIDLVRKVSGNLKPRLTIDVSTFTRKHLLLLLHGLDYSGLLERSRFYHTEPVDYDTQDDEPISQGISSVKAIDTFIGHNHPSQDSLLILFLGYEGRRALALWEHLDPHITLPVIPDPPYKEDWRNRTEVQNCYLLSYLPASNVQRSHSLRPSETERLLSGLISNERFETEKYNYRIAPLGTKAQTLGVYRFCRQHPGVATVMYASPVKYREDRARYPVGRTWLIDDSSTWIAKPSYDR